MVAVMGWVSIQDVPHVCTYPEVLFLEYNRPSYGNGSIWECDECHKRFAFRFLFGYQKDWRQVSDDMMRILSAPSDELSRKEIRKLKRWNKPPVYYGY